MREGEKEKKREREREREREKVREGPILNAPNFSKKKKKKKRKQAIVFRQIIILRPGSALNLVAPLSFLATVRR